jgi:hypothetical protein
MEYEEAKEKIVDRVDQEAQNQIKFYFNDLAKILEMKPRVAKKIVNQLVQDGVLEYWSSGQHLHVRPARHRQTGRAPSTKTNSGLRRQANPSAIRRHVHAFETGSSQPAAPADTGHRCRRPAGRGGKNHFSVGIIAALRSLGRSVAPFKKGPDYIDAGWLALAAGRPCYNLDTFLIDREPSSAPTIPTPKTPILPLSKATAAFTTASTPKGKPAPPNWPSCWACR